MLKPSGFTTLADAPPFQISPSSGQDQLPDAKVPRAGTPKPGIPVSSGLNHPQRQTQSVTRRTVHSTK